MVQPVWVALAVPEVLAAVEVPVAQVEPEVQAVPVVSVALEAQAVLVVSVVQGAPEG